MSQLSSAFLSNFREWCKDQVLATIDAIFQGGGLVYQGPEVHSRKPRIAGYCQGLDLGRAEDVGKVLAAVSTALRLRAVSDEEKDRLRQLCRDEGLRVEGADVSLPGPRHGVGAVNLLYASNGPKPEIVWEDMLTGKIKQIRNANSCLVYDRPVPARGLSWRDLAECWAEKAGRTAGEAEDNRTAFQKRLLEAELNEPERLLLTTYWDIYRPWENHDLPMLIPQVYLHYDPYTLRQRGGEKALERQRMDFLLLAAGQRIVLEVDGQQHYSAAGRADPAKYAEMVRKDRRLRLAGYEVYRFGGKEFESTTAAREMLREFFATLLGRGG